MRSGNIRKGSHFPDIFIYSIEMSWRKIVVLSCSLAAALYLFPLCRAQSKSKAICATLRPVSFCGDPLKPPGSLCGDLPHDVNFKQIQAGYSTQSAVCQQPFDDFGWQTFMALNWPPDQVSTPRVWETYEDPSMIFDPPMMAKMTRNLSWAGATPGAKVLYRMAKEFPLPGEPSSPFLEATGQPLIDRNLNFTLYEVRINPVWVNYVVNTAHLGSLKQQQVFIAAKHKVSFPVGHYDDDVKGTGGSVGAMEIKAAWRILDPSKGDRPDRFYTRRATIYIDGANTVSGTPLVIKDALVGLVALHMNVYTNDGKGTVWPTFEQEDNAPPQNGPSGSRMYSYYNAACATCTPNAPPQPINGEKLFKWSMTAPYAQRYAIEGKYGTQVTIVQPVFSETEQANALWHAKLGNSVWKHYRLVGTHWVNHESETPVGIPPVLGNAALETYIQPKSSCVSCHNQATLAAKPATAADFSFLLGLAH